MRCRPGVQPLRSLNHPDVKPSHKSPLPEPLAGSCRGIPVSTDLHKDESHPVASQDRKSTRLNSSHQIISYAVFCLKKKNASVSTATNGSASSTTFIFRTPTMR